MSKVAVVALAMMAVSGVVHAAEWRPSFQQVREADAAVRRLQRSYSVANYSGYYFVMPGDRDEFLITGILVAPEMHGKDLGLSPVPGLARGYMLTKLRNIGTLGDYAPCQVQEFFFYDPKWQTIVQDTCAGISRRYRSSRTPSLPVFAKPHT